MSVISDELGGVVVVVETGKIDVVVAGFLFVSGQAVYESGAVVE